MEGLFSPCTRYRGMLESQGRLDFLEDFIVHLRELNLDVSTEVFLSAERAFTYADLYGMLESEDAVAWLTPRSAVTALDGKVAKLWGEGNELCRFFFIVDGNVLVALAPSLEYLVEICDVVLRLLAARSVVHSVILRKGPRDGDVSINAHSLPYLTEQCQSLKALTLHDLALDEDHCRVLGGFSRPGLEVELQNCAITDSGASALAEVLGRNQGPTRLDHCDIDNCVLADGLRGNSRLKNFRQDFSEVFDVGIRQVLAIANAVRENKGQCISLVYSRIQLEDGSLAVVQEPNSRVLMQANTWYSSVKPRKGKTRFWILVDFQRCYGQLQCIHDNRVLHFLGHQVQVEKHQEVPRLRQGAASSIDKRYHRRTNAGQPCLLDNLY